jgi:hypothetical protein
MTSDGVRQLVDYRAYLAAVEAKSDVGCVGLRGQLAERAFAAEGIFRVLLAEGLKSLNDLRDSGMLHAGLSEFARTLEGGTRTYPECFGKRVRSSRTGLSLSPKRSAMKP